MPRLLAPRLSLNIGQPVIVENKPGGSTTIGNEFVAKSAPDGYTLLVSTAGMIIAATAFQGLKYDTAAFSSVTVLTRSPLGLVANLDFPPRSVRELIDYAKANPGKVNFGSLGVGTSHQVTGEKLKLAVDQRQQRIAVPGDVFERTVLRDERVRQHREREADQRELGVGRGPRHRHPCRIAALRAEQRQDRLQQHDQQRQHQREMPEFAQHQSFPSRLAGEGVAAPAAAGEEGTACFLCASAILSATSLGM